jgi:putative ABC transport system substrate-binding protein
VDDAVQRKVDLLLTIGQAVFPASEATKTIPIVALNLETDPVAAGLVQSLGRPGGNVTGMFLNAPELGIKQLQILKEVAPELVRVAVLSEPKVSGYQLAAISATSGQLGIAITSLSYRGSKDIEGILASMTAGKLQGLLVLSSPLVNGESPAIADLALRAKVPSISVFRQFCEHGGLIHYGPQLVDLFRRAASTVDQILRGAKPADLPVELPTRFEMVINFKTAKALGLTIPPTLLARADDVLE